MERQRQNEGAQRAWREFVAEEQFQEMPPLTRAPIKGWIKGAFWLLRIYIVILLLLVGLGLYRQTG